MRANGGGIIGWFGTLTDIEDRKRAEAALAESESTYRALSATLPGVTWAASPAGELTFVGERWTSLHGKPREDALGESWLEIVHPDDRERVLAVWARSLSSGEPYDVQFHLRVVDGSYRWCVRTSDSSSRTATQRKRRRGACGVFGLRLTAEEAEFSE